MFLCLERAHGCLGAWEGGPVVPGPPPPGSLGGEPGPNSAGRFVPSALGFRIVFHVDFDVDF